VAPDAKIKEINSAPQKEVAASDMAPDLFNNYYSFILIYLNCVSGTSPQRGVMAPGFLLLLFTLNDLEQMVH